METKTNAGRFFLDFTVEEVIRHAGERTVTHGDMALYKTVTGERRPIFGSRLIPTAMGFPGALTAPDLLVFHLVFGLSVPDISLNSPANLGYADVRFLDVVQEGETLRAESEVVGIRETSKDEVGIVWVRTTGYCGRRKVLQFYRWAMVRKEVPGQYDVKSVVPKLPETADISGISCLQEHSRFTLKNFDLQWTGGRSFWGDYEVGEQLFHPEGLTIFEGVHQMAANLYSNNAAVHFNLPLAEATYDEKKCIVYGGHVISVCHRISTNGLENALWIAGINAGSHLNPVFAGDTLFAMTEVLERVDLGRSDLGALRLRLLGTKTIDPGLDTSRKLRWEEDGKPKYSDETVLDLDYTVLMPKQPSK